MSKKKLKKTMQGQLFRLALKEANIDETMCELDVDHKSGLNCINGIELDLKFPISYIEKINALSHKKIYKYGFKGTTFYERASVRREDFLSPYYTEENLIISTNIGLTRKNKAEFDESFYQLMCNSYFCLAPNWGGDLWDHDDAWTYRFMEAALCKSIPIVFHETPLGKRFTNGICFYLNNQDHTLDDYEKIVEKNYITAVKRWTLQQEEIDQINSTII